MLSGALSCRMRQEQRGMEAEADQADWEAIEAGEPLQVYPNNCPCTVFRMFPLVAPGICGGSLVARMPS